MNKTNSRVLQIEKIKKINKNKIFYFDNDPIKSEESPSIDFKGTFGHIGIFREAKLRKKNGYGYNASRFKIIWKGKKSSWQNLSITWGIRNSDLWQLFPIRNVSDNSNRSIIFGFWKFFLQISYSRARNSNYLFTYPYFKNFRRIYLLLF